MNQNGSIPLILVIGILLSIGFVATGAYVYTHPVSPPPPPGPAETNPVPSNLGEVGPSSSPAPLTLDFLNQAQLTEQNIKTSPKLLASHQLPDGSTQYDLKSYLDARPDIAIFKDGKTIYRRTVTVTTELIHPKLSTYLSKLGTPDKTLTGSKYYGPFENIYVYGAKGVTLTANPNTDEIDNIETYLPTTTDDYLAKWGSDYLPFSGPLIDNF